MLQANRYSQYNQKAEQWKDRYISKNYSTIYLQLLREDTCADPKTKQLRVPCKKPFYIGNKDVYALSDIEGNNITFLNFLQNLNLVDYRLDRPLFNNMEWNKCYTRAGNGNCYIWYKFNKQACENFKDVIVLCGDYIGHDNSPDGEYSRGTVKILTQLNNLLNNRRAKEEDKRLFLVAGNHDIFFHSDDKGLSEMKKEILKLGLYPQLLLKNANGEKLLFQHTNFPYRERRNTIRNKRIDTKKAEKFIEKEQLNNKENNMLDFFYLRSEMDNIGGIIYRSYDGKKTQLQKELFTDHGIGYDAKFVGHDVQQYGCFTKHQYGGELINCHSYNKNKEFAYWQCGQKKLLINNAKKITYFTKPNLTLNQQRNEKYFKLLSNLDQLFSTIVTNKNIRNEFCKGICNELLNKKYL